jgi:uncharacterized protein YhjY with autotransporter beta-barrel domain
MKLISYSRRQILRAIHAACIALFLIGVASRAQAQTFTAPFVINGPTVTTSPAGVYPGAVGFYDNVNTYNSISVSSGVSIENTSQFGSPINGIYGVISASTGNLSNAGLLSISTAADPQQAAVNLSQAGVPLTITNTGTMTVTAGANVGYAIFVFGNTGSVTATNSGLLTVSGAADSNVIDLSSVSDNVSFINKASGTLTLTNPGLGYIVKLNTGDANIAFENDGTMTGSTYGVRLGANNGTITSVNTGTIAITGAGNDGIMANGSGRIALTNSGVITGSGSAYGMIGSGGSLLVSLSNSGNISGFTNGLTGFGNGPVSLTNSGTITTSGSAMLDNSGGPASSNVVTNSGYLHSTGGDGIDLLSPGTVYDSGNITSAGNSINVPSGSSVTLAGAPVINNIIQGGATAASTSTLAFNLVVPAAEFNSVQAILKADIAQYNTQSGGYLDFNLGPNLNYEILNFAANGITNGVLPSRNYSLVPGFSGLGSALDNFGLNPTTVSILTALNNINDPGLPAALAELSPKDLEVFRNIAFDNNTFYVAQINNHLANLRDGMTGFDSSALSINSGDVDPGLAPINDHLKTYSAASRPGLTNGLVDPKDMKEMRDPKSLQTFSEPADRWSTFIAGNVILANLDNSLPYQNADYTTGAVTAGADYRLDDNFTVGALFSYAHTEANLDYHGSHATVDSYAPGIYASYVNGGWYANGLATYVRNTYTEDREIDIPGIGGDNHGATSGNQGTGNLTGGYEFQYGSFKFGPVVTVEYVHLDINSIQEQGPTSLNIADQSDDSLRTLIGFEGRYASAVAVGSDRWILTPHFSASWQHEYLDNSNGITSQFSPAGGGSFDTPLDNPERDSAFIDAGLDAQVNKTVTVFVDYQVQAGQDDFFAQSVQGGIRISF